MTGSKQAPPIILPQQQNTTQTVQLPQWVQDAGQENYQAAKDLASRPFQGYGAPMVADQSALEGQAPGILQSAMGQANNAFGTGMGAANAASVYRNERVVDPRAVGDVRARSFLDADINKYMDPFNEQVVSNTMRDMQRGAAQNQQGISDQARGAGAWGGSRFAVQQAVQQAEDTKNQGSMAAQLRSSAYNNATGLVQQDNASALQAALANQQSGLTTEAQRLQSRIANQNAGLSAANLRLQGGQLASQIGGQYAQTGAQNALLTNQFGANQRSIEQAKLDAGYNEFMRGQQYPQDMMNMRLAALGMTPYNKTTTGSMTGFTSQAGGSSNPMMQALGVGMTALPLLFSDPKVKKNVKKLGKIPGTDLHAHKFEYKTGFMGRPMGPQVGLMADEVEKKVPSAVKKVVVGRDTVKAVDYPKALAGARDSRDDKGMVRRPYRPRGVGIGSRMRAM
jgi:hypothetical protein